MGPPSQENLPEDGKLKSEIIVKDNRRYYLDLKENQRGRFLRVSQTNPVVGGGGGGGGLMGGGGGPLGGPHHHHPLGGGPAGPLVGSGRSQIAIPAQGLIEFRDALTDLLEEFGLDEGGGQAKLPSSRFMRADSKIFYFDTGNNQRGTFLRVSEVRSNFRTAITIPEKFWPKFRDILGEIIGEYQDNKKVGEEKRGGGGGATGGGGGGGVGGAAGGGEAESEVSSVVGAAERGLSDVSDQDEDDEET